MAIAAASAIALVYGVLALGSGLDRAGEDRPALAAWVPDAIAIRSLKARGSHLLETRQGPALVDLGGRYVGRAPYDGVASALLGAGLLMTGKDIPADKAFRVAAQFGWRLPLVQAYWLDQSLRLGDGELAAMRLDALLRQNPGRTSSAPLLAPFESQPELQPYLIARMAMNPDWVSYFSGDVSANVSNERIAQRAAILDQLAAQGHPRGCAGATPITQRLVLQGQIAMAMQYWQAQCPDAGTGLLRDGQLRQVTPDNQNATAFGWELLTNGDMSVDVQPTAGGNMLQLRNGSGFALPFTRQLIVAAPGDYDLTWYAKGGNAGGATPVAPTLDCQANGLVPPLAVSPAGADRWTSRVHLGAECEGHWLGFQLAGNSRDVAFGSVTLRPAGGR
jgi:hypothetical protein